MKQDWMGERYSRKEKNKEKGEDTRHHIAGERPGWTPRYLGESGWELH